MIGIAEEAEVQTLDTPDELHGALIGLYGRVFRVQLLSKEISDLGFYYDDEYSEPPAKDIWTKSDHIGRLIGIEFTQHRERSDGKTSAGSGPYLGLKLEGSKNLLYPGLNRSLIEVLQEDTGAWIPIHRALSWQQDHETLELTA